MADAVPLMRSYSTLAVGTDPLVHDKTRRVAGSARERFRLNMTSRGHH